MAAILVALETATTNCSVALTDQQGKTYLKEDYGSNYSHGEKLHLYIQAVLEEAGISHKDLQAVAVSAGPGSYTGLRIGVSAAKGLCFALDIPLITINTLESLAHQLHPEHGYIVAMLDARRMEAYTAVYDHVHKNLQAMRPEILSPDSFRDYLDKDSVHFIGTANQKFKEICKHPNAEFINDCLPSANELLALAKTKFKLGDFADLAYFEPQYLKAFQAG